MNLSVAGFLRLLGAVDSRLRGNDREQSRRGEKVTRLKMALGLLAHRREIATPGFARLAMTERKGAVCLAMTKEKGTVCLAMTEIKGAVCLAMTKEKGAVCLAMTKRKGCCPPCRGRSVNPSLREAAGDEAILRLRALELLCPWPQDGLAVRLFYPCLGTQKGPINMT